LENMVSLFPFLKVKYEFEPIGLCHYVQVLPSTSYHNNQEYIRFEMSLEDNFGSFYKDEDVCFLTEGSLYEITNPIYEKQGLFYGESEIVLLPVIFNGYNFNFPTKLGFMENGSNFYNFSSSKFTNVSCLKPLNEGEPLEDNYSEGYYTQAA
jgi:hypothetical protein